MLQNLLRCLYWIIIVFMQTSKCRRYDIEQEAQNLYSTNLKSVIEKFRRTPEYLKILNDQMALIQKNTDLIVQNTFVYYADKLKEKVNEIFGVNGTNNLRTIRQIQFRKILRKPREKLRKNRQHTGKGIYLEYYKKFHTALSLEQKNRMKDLGFEFAGRAIHAMLNHILPDGALPMSTMHLYGGDTPGISTTVFHHDHEITQHSTPETKATVSTNHHQTYTTDDMS